MLLTIPMLIPSISHGLGLINLFGANGIISKILGFNIIGCHGIIIGSILYSFPVAFLMLDDGFNYIDNNMYNTAKVLGLNQWQTFKKSNIMLFKKTIIIIYICCIYNDIYRLWCTSSSRWKVFNIASISI